MLPRIGLFVACDLLLFAITAIWYKDAGASLEVAIGTRGPFQTPVGAFPHAPMIAVPFAIISWLLVPALAGGVVAGLLEAWTKASTSPKALQEARDKFWKKFAASPETPKVGQYVVEIRELKKDDGGGSLG